MSATYRQSSNTRPELVERDPQNTLLARQNRLRLESEIIRDLHLAAGGLLNEAVGGPSFRPKLPDTIKSFGGAGAFVWTDTEGPEKYRRGLYIYAQRTVPYPVSMTFDQANPSETCPQRERSNTPLQALTLMNHGTFVECAQSLARRLYVEKVGDTGQKINYGFQLCLGRNPTSEELARLERLYDAELKLANANSEAPSKLTVGMNLEKSQIAPVAAFITLAQVMMNLDEFFTRE